ncbi:MAG: sulfatase [Rikenellaceae bacterium]
MKKSILFLSSCALAISANAQDKQNIVFILVDDLGWADLGVNGSDYYETPNIDRLAAQGIFFSNAHSASPVSSPARGAIMTGRTPARTGYTGLIGQWGKPAKGNLIDADFAPNIATEEFTLAEAFKSHGYKTMHFGKWHLGETEPTMPLAQGFDTSITGYEEGKWKQQRFNEKGEFITDLLTDKALESIKENKDEPFFLNLCYYAVHTPIVAKPNDIAYFKEKAVKMGLDSKEAIITGELQPALPWFKQEKGVKGNVARRVIQSDPTYAAFLYCLDQNIGRVMDLIEELNLTDKTTFVFYSDNGGLSVSAGEGTPTCNAPLNEGKGWAFEGGIRVPLIVSSPKSQIKGTVCDAPIVGTDLYPTLLEIAELPLEKKQHVDGESFKAALDGKSIKRSPIFWHSPHYFNQGGYPFSAVLDGDWKYTYCYDLEKAFLFNIKEDLSEQNNLINSHTKEAKRLKKLLDKYLTEVDAKFPSVR